MCIRDSTGTYPLQDVFDMRPRVEDIAGTNTSVSVVDEVNGNSFDFEHRQFDGTGASTVHTLKPGSSIQSDFEYFLPYRAYLHIDRSGRFVITKGAAAEQPEFPKEPDGMMKLAEIIVPAFTFKPSDVRILKEKNQRYTMKDIGRLERRIDTVEYYSALSLLERDAESFEIQDSNGLNRFKSGFISIGTDNKAFFKWLNAKIASSGSFPSFHVDFSLVSLVISPA